MDRRPTSVTTHNAATGEIVMTERDFETLFAYFIGAINDHTVHVHVLIHAGFTVE